MNQIEFYDTRSRSSRPFEPITPGRVGIYTCGPTVYAPQHVGNIRSRLLPDLLKRFLQSEGFEVTLVKKYGVLAYVFAGFPDHLGVLRFIPGNALITKMFIWMDRVICAVPVLSLVGFHVVIVGRPRST